MYMYIYMLIKISSINCHNIAVSRYIIDTATGKAYFAIKLGSKGLLYVCAINIIRHNCKLYIYTRKKENSAIYGHHKCMYKVYTLYSTNTSVMDIISCMNIDSWMSYMSVSIFYS